jgi:hypothetical protein
MPGAEPAIKPPMVTALLLFGPDAIGAKLPKFAGFLAGSVNRQRTQPRLKSASITSAAASLGDG